jgi:hypothetical protein
VSNFDTFIFEDADASEESPSTLPSNKFQYIMTVNNSKLARRPYYKKLVSNEFESQFCQILDPPLVKSRVAEYSRKYAILYQVFMKAK